MKFAYFGIPHTGGTWTVFTSLRNGLAPLGVEVEWLGTGPAAQAALNNPVWSAFKGAGKVVAPAETDESRRGRALVEYLENAPDLDGVFVNVLAGRVETNAMRYLSDHLRRIMIVHSITPGTYGAARTIRDHVHAAIGVSPRIQDDLINRHGFPTELTHAIPNAVDLRPFRDSPSQRCRGEPLRLLYLGRVIDSDKGVFWLPQLINKITPGLVELTIVGDGPDLPALKDQFAVMNAPVSFPGRVSPDQVPEIMASHDAFIFPSRFEGLGLSLVEAMAAGCVPVATRIKGVTDFVVTHGRDGFLFPMGDMSAAAQAIEQLARDTSTLERMSQAARGSVQDRFDLNTMASAYKDVMHSVVMQPRTLREPLSLDSWKYPPGLRKGLRSYLPTGVKNYLRGLREQLA